MSPYSLFYSEFRSDLALNNRTTLLQCEIVSVTGMMITTGPHTEGETEVEGRGDIPTLKVGDTVMLVVTLRLDEAAVEAGVESEEGTDTNARVVETKTTPMRAMVATTTTTIITMTEWLEGVGRDEMTTTMKVFVVHTPNLPGPQYLYYHMF